MKVLGIKYTHDAAVALVEDGVLRFSVEMEKVANRERRTKMLDRAWVDEVLAAEGVTSVDQVVVDGWKSDRMRFVPAAGYNEFEGGEDRPLLQRESFPEAQLGVALRSPYSSFTHSAGHLLGSYAMSPFAAQQEDALLLSWDGGVSARAYLFQPRLGRMTRLGVVLDICASVYGNMGLYFGPFKDQAVLDAADIPHRKFGSVEWPGKLMSYAALGQTRQPLLDAAATALDTIGPGSNSVSDDSVREHGFLRALRRSGFEDADVVASIQAFLTDRLVTNAMKLLPPGLPLVLSGGAFLNIRWNSALRASGHFAAVWAPPAVNDSGSAIGAAACELWHRTKRCHIDWSVYSGPRVPAASHRRGWERRPVNAGALAARIAAGDVVAVVRGRSEIGPRALGHRSLLCDARDRRVRDQMNRLKQREGFRPLAPVCLERRAREIFDPGTPDPYMLFEHRARLRWALRISGALHVDGSARLQTINAQQEPFLNELLERYEELTDVPLLANTSANLPGRGFFPTAEAAMDWSETHDVRLVVTDDATFERAQ
jgi:carbamoyltransferase